MREDRIIPRRITVPAWEVSSIDVREDHLRVRVEDSFFPPMSDWDAKALGQQDFLSEFYSSPHRTRASSRSLPHVRFASIKNEAELIAFVNDFGPLLARRERIPQWPGHYWFFQNLEVLKVQQKVFAATSFLVSLVNGLNELSLTWAKDTSEPKYLDRRTSLRVNREDRLLLAELKPALDQLQAQFKAAVECSSGQHPTDEFALVLGRVGGMTAGDSEFANLSTSHRLLCEIFNLFLPKLYYTQGVVMECPDSAATGIRPLLYFLLRQVYLAKHILRLCKRDDCGQFFVAKSDKSRFCCDSCSSLFRQRQFTRRHSPRRSAVHSGGPDEKVD